MRIIRRTAGQVAYVGGTVKDVTGADLSGVEFRISFGTEGEPGTVWYTPDVVEDRDGGREVKALIPSAVENGDYYLWIKAADLPEVDLLLIPYLLRIT